MKQPIKSETVYSTYDAARLMRMGCTGVSSDPKLAKGEWYHKHNPKQINKLFG